MKHRFWISFSGFVWLAVGFMLLYKGLKYLSVLPDQSVATWWMAGGLFIGFLKGRFVLSKTVKRISDRIAGLSLPISPLDVYPKSYWMMLGSMMLIGFALRLIPIEWRGAIDVAVGSALINGAMLYFRQSRLFVVR